jgi:hypothetical protein
MSSAKVAGGFFISCPLSAFFDLAQPAPAARHEKTPARGRGKPVCEVGHVGRAWHDTQASTCLACSILLKVHGGDVAHR